MLYSYLSSSALETLLDSSALSRLNFLISSFKIRISSNLSLYCTSPVYLTYFVSNGIIISLHYTYIIHVHTLYIHVYIHVHNYTYMYIQIHTCTLYMRLSCIHVCTVHVHVHNLHVCTFA